MICGLFLFIGGYMDTLVSKLIALSYAVVLWVALVLLTINIQTF